MIKNGKGGGNTKTGLVFEGKTDLATFLNKLSDERYEFFSNAYETEQTTLKELVKRLEVEITEESKQSYDLEKSFQRHIANKQKNKQKTA